MEDDTWRKVYGVQNHRHGLGPRIAIGNHSVTRAGAGGIGNAGTGVQKMFLASSASAHSPSGKWIESLSAAPTLFIRQSR